jgi:hypothetical protein
MLKYFPAVLTFFVHLGYFMTTWYILGTFGTFFRFWYRSPKSLARYARRAAAYFFSPLSSDFFPEPESAPTFKKPPKPFSAASPKAHETSKADTVTQAVGSRVTRWVCEKWPKV